MDTEKILILFLTSSVVSFIIEGTKVEIMQSENLVKTMNTSLA